MALHIPDIRAICSNVSFVILYADFITNVTNVMNATDFDRLFSGKPLANHRGHRRAEINSYSHSSVKVEKYDEPQINADERRFINPGICVKTGYFSL